MSKFKTAKEKRRRRRIKKAAERVLLKKAERPGVEIISQTFRQIGDVAVTFTIGRINSKADAGK